MKNTLLSLGILLMGVLGTTEAMAQAPTEAGAVMAFDKEVHDYGEIEQHADGSCAFEFTNTGSEPLIISNAKGSCGCTVPEWPREPIMPGESAAIKVKYDTKRVGPINKSVTITANTATPTKVIRITGSVKAAPAVGAPVKDNNPLAPKVGDGQ